METLFLRSRIPNSKILIHDSRNPKFETYNPKFKTLNLKPKIWNWKPKILTICQNMANMTTSMIRFVYINAILHDYVVNIECRLSTSRIFVLDANAIEYIIY